MELAVTLNTSRQERLPTEWAGAHMQKMLTKVRQKREELLSVFETLAVTDPSVAAMDEKSRLQQAATFAAALSNKGESEEQVLFCTPEPPAELQAKYRDLNLKALSGSCFRSVATA